MDHVSVITSFTVSTDDNTKESECVEHKFRSSKVKRNLTITSPLRTRNRVGFSRRPDSGTMSYTDTGLGQCSNPTSKGKVVPRVLKKETNKQERTNGSRLQ